MKRSLAAVALGLALTACSTQGLNDRPLEVWSNFKQSSVSSQQLEENQSLVVFYRQNDVQGSAVNVYVNGDYQTSLLPNAYSAVSVCATKNLFTSSFSTTKDFGNRTQGMYYTLPANEIVYVKVKQETNGKLNFVRIEKSVAENEVAKLPKENQTLSRVRSNNCSDK
ncbi:hypothetical protein BKK49_11495 [Rodentibacter rarus]|uniref:DUF2846 domain-containing protein n=1 Tax=Rodentibacter rarus TaxID=1908260 RepID=A0A1V3IDV7_9PAST|nr:hypothetical protein [Rodentibacter rarus]OOF37295.1 hypothetical protein BKK49_11495 [Rodentibacter rarus]OOF38370.1 hypothetical protein BKK50_11765 [Rodentibacter rarus]